MKSRMHTEETRQTSAAKSNAQSLRAEMHALMARQRQFEAAIRMGVQGALDMLEKGDVEQAKITLLTLKGIVAA